MSHLDEPMIPAYYESRERMLGWDVPRIASDPEAVKAVLKEYMLLLLFEHGDDWKHDLFDQLIIEAYDGAIEEYRTAKIIRERAKP